MIEINQNKLSELTNAEDILSREYGKPGSISRDKFHEEAQSWYLGELMRDRRKQLRITQQQLADKIGTARSYIAKVERGETDIQMSSFLKITRALGIGFTPTFL